MQAIAYQQQHLTPTASNVDCVQVRVVRTGQECSISIYDLLVGDVLLVDTGEFSRMQASVHAQKWLKSNPS